MNAAYFDCFAGVSGDMILGALIDLGLDPQVLEGELRKLPVTGYRLRVERVERRGIQAASFQVLLQPADPQHAEQSERLADSEFIEVNPMQGQQPGDAATNPGSSPADQLHHDAPSRSLTEILTIIRTSALSELVKSRSCRIFTRLAEAEGKVHGLPADQVHFHEVGGVDAILDIVGACVGLELLGIETVYASPLHLGGGFVRSAHGLLPVPAPATAELLTGVPVYTSQATGELVTPTGAAILVTLASSFGAMPPMTVEAVGYGAGTRQREFPNVVRVFLGKSGANRREPRDPYPEQHATAPGPAGYHDAPAVAIEANLDDLPPQLFENLLEKLLAAGALDVMLIPAQMKKDRPGMFLHVLAPPDAVEQLLLVIFRESTTIGARTYPVTKHMLQRKIVEVQTPYGAARVKIARLGQEVVNLAPEYEDCRKLADERGVPLKEVLIAAQTAARESLAAG